MIFKSAAPDWKAAPQPEEALAAKHADIPASRSEGLKYQGFQGPERLRSL
ncbi:MAG: hypothetical protein KGZ61_06000 [Sandarakinorhabdus sp.]|nr:hypothetical protein [Sandarakinorhabdus sp.]